MSGASGKILPPWRELMRIRKYGERAPGEFSWKQRVLFASTAATIRMFVRMCTDTCRWSEAGSQFRHDLQLGRTAVIFLMWHNRVPGFFPWVDSLSRRDPNFRVCSIVSGSKDGELLARPIRENGGGVIRGSSTRDAAAALRGGVAAAHAGASIATVGDGPLGPRYRLKPGPVLLAKVTGLPIVPVTWACSRTFQLHRSWDQLMLPLPFSRITFRFGKPRHVAPDADAEAIAAARLELEQALSDMTAWADGKTGIAIQFPKPKANEVLKRKRKVELTGRHVE